MNFDKEDQIIHLNQLNMKKVLFIAFILIGHASIVAIARTLINKPSLIIGDETTRNLESQNTDIIFRLFRELWHEKGQTILTITHGEDFAR